MDISERARKLIGWHCAAWNLKGRYDRLEEETGVKSRAWRMLFLGQTRATVETLEALAKLEPEFAAWLIAGDSAKGVKHIEVGSEWWRT